MNRTNQIDKDAILLFSTQRNEHLRLPYFLEYYRDIGVTHFLIVDNDSTDGTSAYLAQQPDVSLWQSKGSYKAARFGVDWLNHLMSKYGHRHWCMVADTDEFFVYPFCDTRPLRALTDWLDGRSMRTFSAMLLDMYPQGALGAEPYLPGQNPIDTDCWFDSGNYTMTRDGRYGNLLIQGGPRARCFFADRPRDAPALNKIPLIKWDRSYAYVSSTHMLLPRGLNLVYDEHGGEKASGVLLHTKFRTGFRQKAIEEIDRQEHYADLALFKAYATEKADNLVFWSEWSEKYINWRQLEILGLMSKGSWA